MCRRGGGEFGNKVGEGDVDEVSSGEGEENGDIGVPGECPGDEPAHDDGGAGSEVVGEGGAAAPAGVEEDPEIAEFLGDLVGGENQPGHDAQFGADDEGSADREAVDEVVEGVGDQDQVPERAVGGGRAVAVMPVQVLLEQEASRKKASTPAATHP